MKISIAAAGIAAIAAAGTAQASTIVNASASTSVVDLAAAGSKDLSNNGAYASGSGRNAIGYLFDEGVNSFGTNATTAALGIAGQSAQSYLLHYDRRNGSGFLGGLATGSVSGSFSIQLGAGETFLGLAGYTSNPLFALATANALRDTDALAGVTYPNTTFTSALFRGTEGTLFGDRITTSLAGSLVNVRYDLASTGLSLDQVRFFVSPAAAVPEPATWAMMIGGVGLVGGAMRRRRAARPALATA